MGDNAGFSMAWPVWLGLALGLLAVIGVGLAWLGRRRWQGLTQALLTRLEASRVSADCSAKGARQAPAQGDVTPTPVTRYDARELTGLPAPVQRYFRAVLKDGQPIITAATISMAGRFNRSPTGAHWGRFTSRQRVVTQGPGFLWDASISMLPGLPVRVVDSYIAGNGLLRAAVQGLFNVASLQGAGEIARGEFMRWFAEVAWYPTALLPSQGVQWQAVDAHSAQAAVVDGPISLTLLFRFDEAGLLASFRAEARGGMVGKEMVMAPWEGAWSNYQWRCGIRVPLVGEVAWMRPEGRQPYFIGTVTAFDLEFAA